MNQSHKSLHFAEERIDPDAQVSLLKQLLGSLWLPGSIEDEFVREKMSGAMALLRELRPQDASESMLAVQMIATHEAAVECLRRAILPNRTFEGRDMALRHATKLMGIYERQLAALDKRRGRGQKSVTVKYVHVGQGGQAIVGNVSHSGTPMGGADTTPRELEASVEAPMDMLDAEAPALTAAAETEASPARPPAQGRPRKTR
jgi:hypothetical protein